MTASSGDDTPASPETQADYVKDELDQDQITHQGEQRKPPVFPQHGGGHLGAVEDEQTPVVTPMSGPADLTGERGVNGQGNETASTDVDELFDPRDELTPG